MTVLHENAECGRASAGRLTPDVIGAIDFLQRWADGAEPRSLLVSIVPDSRTTHGHAFALPGDEAMVRWIERCNGVAGIYWTVNACKPALAKKATKADVEWLLGIWGDLDPLKGCDLPIERERLLRLAEELMALPRPPTVIIDSGGGIQPLWRLETPLEAVQEFRQAIEALGRRIEAALGGVENTCNIDRVLRLPFTINHPNRLKVEQGRVPVMSGILAETGRRYAWADLEALATQFEDEPPGNAAPVEYRERRYPKGQDDSIDPGGDLPPYATKEQVDALLKNVPHLRAIWDQTTLSPPPDSSPSGWDQRFASALAREGFRPVEIVSFLRAYRAHHEPGKGKQDRPDYLWRTIEAATRDWELSLDEDEPAAGEAAGGNAQANGQQQTAGDAQGKNRGTFQGTKAKPADDWPEPGVLGEPPPAPKFPTELLPCSLQRWVEGQAETMGVPCDVLALPALVCIAGSIGKNAVLKPKRNDMSWTERPCLWGALVMPKGSLKSSAIKAAMSPLRAAEARARERWQDQVRAWEGRQARTKNGQIKPSDEDPKPNQPKLVIGDATIEAIADAMVESRGLTMIRDELSGLIANMSRYNKGSDRPFYLECHAGGCYTVDRIIRGRQIVPDVYLNIFGGIQPKIAKKAFASAAQGEDDGFFERFGLICYPDPIPWTGVKDEIPDRDYKQLVREACVRLSTTDWSLAVHALMRFDDQAQEGFLAWHDQHMRTRVRMPEAEERLDHGFMSKGSGLVLRLTITLHLYRWTCGEAASPSRIDLASLEAAIGIFDRYCVPMYARVCKAFAEPEAHEGVARICHHIKAKKLAKIRVADVTKLSWQGLAERGPVLKAFEALEDIDWLRRAVEPSGPRGGRPSDHWLVNPKVLQ